MLQSALKLVTAAVSIAFFNALCDKIKATGAGGNPVKSQDTIKDALMVVTDIQ